MSVARSHLIHSLVHQHPHALVLEAVECPKQAGEEIERLPARRSPEGVVSRPRFRSHLNRKSHQAAHSLTLYLCRAHY